jgi:hypothetical protein
VSRHAPDPVEEADGGPAARLHWFLQSRSNPEGQMLRGIFAKAASDRRRIEQGESNVPGTPSGPGSVNWTPIGPSVIDSGLVESGRITALAIGPGGSRVYVGAADGGVWFSPDGGSTWSPLDDYIVSPSLFGGAAEADSLSTGAIAVHFGASAIGDEVFIGTGEANGNYDAYFGIGVRHLAAGTWTLEATNLVGRGMYAVVIDPNDSTPTNVYAATTSGIYKRPTSGSFASWTPVTSPTFTSSSGAASSLIAAGSGGGRTFYAAFYNDKVYSSPDGTTWTALSGIPASVGRIALAASESSPGVVYALCANGSIYRLSGTTFYAVTGLPPAVLFADPQGWYDIAIAVDPSNPNMIIVGGDAYAVFKGTITGSPGTFTFPFNPANTSTPWLDSTWVGANVHSDVHAIMYGLNTAGSAHDPTNVWVGSDGGVFQSTTSGSAGSFQSRNIGLAITQFAYLAQRADTDAVIFAGAQDNGTPRILGEQASRDTAGGDGGGVAMDPGNPYRVMRQYVRASLYKSTDGGASWSSAGLPPAGNATENGATGFVAPLRAFASGSTTLAAFGTNRLWITPDWGVTWVTLPSATNPYTSSPPNLTQDVIDGNAIRAIAFASINRIYAATPGTIWRYDGSGAGWSKTVLPTTGLPASRFITALAPDLDPAASPGTLYATLGGGGVAHVYHFDGTSWTAALPTTVVDAPTHAIVIDPVTPTDVYVGTDVGCFKGKKTSGTTWTWSLFSSGLPEAAITDLGIFAAAPPSRLLRAATHGRSAWEIDLNATSGADPDIYLRVNYADTGRLTPAAARFPWVEGALDPTHQGYQLYHWMSADIKVRRSSLSGLPALGSPVSYLDFAFNVGDYVDTTTHMETGDVSGSDRVFVEIHNRSLNLVPAAQVRVLLLWTDASAALPLLPSNWAAHINAGDTSPAWLAGSSWSFADISTPYRTLVRDLDVRTPQVVEYAMDFSTLGLVPGHDHMCLAAFVTTPADAIISVLSDLNQVTLNDKHVAHRNVHLVALGLRPGTSGLPGGLMSETIVIDFHNPGERQAAFDLVFDRRHFVGKDGSPGYLSLILPQTKTAHSLSGFTLVKRDARALAARHLIGEWLERLGAELQSLGDAIEDDITEAVLERREIRRAKLAALDQTHVYVAGESTAPAIVSVVIPARGRITAAFTIQAPTGAAPGDRFRLDVMQQDTSSKKILGGSTYVVAITKSSRAAKRRG